MKDLTKFQNTVEQYNKSSASERRTQILLAFEAEYDIARPFEVNWDEDDKSFSFEGNTYFYRPQYPNGVEVNGELLSESPHFYEFTLNK